MNKDPKPASDVFKPDPAWAQTSKDFKILSIDELGELDPPKALLGRFLPKPGLTVAYGPPKCGKTFLLLDMGLRIASGHAAYDGSPVVSGSVLWVAAEGRGSLEKRISAWCLANDVSRPQQFHVLPEAVNLFKEEGFDLQIALEKRGIEPVAIFFDTLSRCSSGGNESLPKDMRIIVDSASRLIQRFDANVTLVHHSGKSSDSSRGTNSLPADADQVFRLSSRELTITVKSVAERDAAPFEDLKFGLTPFGESAAVQYRGPASAGKREKPEAKEKVSACLQRVSPREWIATKAIIEHTGLSKASVSRSLKSLSEQGLLEVREGSGNDKGYRLRAPLADEEGPTASILSLGNVVTPLSPKGEERGGTTTCLEEARSTG